jgi:hypothetical protein
LVSLAGEVNGFRLFSVWNEAGAPIWYDAPIGCVVAESSVTSFRKSGTSTDEEEHQDQANRAPKQDEIRPALAKPCLQPLKWTLLPRERVR